MDLVKVATNVVAVKMGVKAVILTLAVIPMLTVVAVTLTTLVVVGATVKMLSTN